MIGKFVIHQLSLLFIQVFDIACQELAVHAVFTVLVSDVTTIENEMFHISIILRLQPLCCVLLVFDVICHTE